MAITGPLADNGVNVQALLDARDTLSATPEAAQFTWRASCTWRNGTHSRSAIAGFTGLGGEQRSNVNETLGAELEKLDLGVLIPINPAGGDGAAASPARF